jgi:hypothetical protein
MVTVLLVVVGPTTSNSTVCLIVRDLETSKRGGLGLIWTVVSQKEKWDTILGHITVTSNSESRKGTGTHFQ